MHLDVEIRRMEEADIVRLGATFAEWHKTVDKYRTYYKEQKQNSRVVLVAESEARVFAYVTLVWEPVYEWFRREGIPEIIDLNVMTKFQRQGTGTGLILAAEGLARSESRKKIGISVEQSPEYTAAQRLYLAMGYVPDGHGVTPHDNEIHLIKAIV